MMFNASVQGIHDNLVMFYNHARKMQNIEKADLARDTVGMIIAEKGVGANVAALKAANKMYDNILDILA